MPREIGLPTADLFNRIRSALLRAANVHVGSGLRLDPSAGSRAIARDVPEHFRARLVSGSGGGPYRFRRVRVKSGVWTDFRDVDDKATAYEFNLIPSPLNTVVMMRDVGLAGEYRFTIPRLGGGGGLSCEDAPFPEPPAVMSLTLFRVQKIYRPDTLELDETIVAFPMTYHSGSTIRNPFHFGFSGNPTSYQESVTGFWRSDCQLGSAVYPGAFGSDMPPSTWILAPNTNPLTGARTIGYIANEIWPADGGGDCAATIDSPAVDNSPESGTPNLTTDGSLYDFWTCSGDAFGGPYLAVSGCDGTFDISLVRDFPFRGTAQGVVISIDGALPATINIPIHVHAPDCDGIPGADIAGATVTISGGPSGLGSIATTDGSGIATVSAIYSGVYGLSIEADGCTTTRLALVTGCNAPPVDVPLCCSHACILVSGFLADADTAGTPESLGGANITGLGGVWTADSSGQVCNQVPSGVMTALPVAPGGNCNVRRATLRISHPSPGWLDRCITVDIPCGRTLLEAQAAPATATLYSIRNADDSNRYEMTTLCPDTGCFAGGWINRSLVTVQEAFRLNQLQYEHYNDDFDPGAGTTWKDMRPSDLMGTTFLLDLDTALLAGDVPGSTSPFGTLRRVEYYGSGTGTWTPRGGTSPMTTAWEAWACKGQGLWLRLEIPAYDPADPSSLGTITLPPGIPEGSALTAQSIDILMPFDFDPCTVAGGNPGANLPTAMDNGLGFRWDLDYSQP